jgi:hypothetical protein
MRCPCAWSAQENVAPNPSRPQPLAPKKNGTAGKTIAYQPMLTAYYGGGESRLWYACGSSGPRILSLYIALLAQEGNC